MQCKMKGMHLQKLKHAMMWNGKTMQEDKLSYMQMQEWLTTTYLMARARVSHLERDYPYLGFGRRHPMEMLVVTLPSAPPSM